MVQKISAKVLTWPREITRAAKLHQGDSEGAESIAELVGWASRVTQATQRTVAINCYRKPRKWLESEAETKRGSHDHGSENRNFKGRQLEMFHFLKHWWKFQAERVSGGKARNEISLRRQALGSYRETRRDILYFHYKY